MILEWDNRKHKKTVGIDRKSSNIGRLWTAPGYKKYVSYSACTDSLFTHLNTIKCMNLELTENGDEIVVVDDVIYEAANETIELPDQSGIAQGYNQPSLEDKVTASEWSEATTMTAEDELLRWHHRLSHVSMKRIQRMATAGLLPSKLARCRIPLCQACVFGKLTRKPWRGKPNKTDEKRAYAASPGQCVSVDQLECPILGLFGQMKGILTKKRSIVATIFVDHYSNFSYVHLQTSTSAEETIEAKNEFETMASSFNVNIRQYHADNGRFAELAWKHDIRQKNQLLTFSGVGAHHQNGRVEKRIQDLQDLSRTSIIHANRRWPQAVDVRLWPYAVRHANHSLNHTPFAGQDLTPIELFSGSKVRPHIDQHHPFGCLAYALDGKVQTGKKAPKWDKRARLAIYLGPSMHHASSVGFLLSLTTGLVSPQFHVRYDDTFCTLNQGAARVPCIPNLHP